MVDGAGLEGWNPGVGDWSHPESGRCLQLVATCFCRENVCHKPVASSLDSVKVLTVGPPKHLGPSQHTPRAHPRVP